MIRMLITGLLAGAPMLAASAQASLGPDAIVGFWQTEGGGAVIEIRAADTGANANGSSRYQGRLAWLRESRYPTDDPQGMAGKRVVDRHNPDHALRARPLIGLRLLAGLRYRARDDGSARWVDGRVYDTENGKHYDCVVWLADDNHLKLRGYVGIELLGRTTTWTRAADPNDKPST